MENFKIDPGIYFPTSSEPSLISPVIQEYERSGRDIQSQEDFAKSISMPGDSITDLINKVQQYNERTESLIGQMPQAPSFGGVGTQIDLSQSINKLSRSLNPSRPTLQASAKPDVLGTADELERYSQSKDFQTFGYVPSLGSEQEYRYGRAMTWGDTVGKALSGAGALAFDTFVEGWKGWGRMAQALFTWDASKLYGTPEERYEIAKQQEAIFNKYAIYNTEQSEDSLLNRQFFGNMLQQSGFTVGALGQMALETYLTAGFGKAISAGVGSFAKARELKNFINVSELINDTRKAQKVITNSERVTNAFKSIPRAVLPLYGTVQDLTKLRKAGAGALQLGMIGLGGVKRELSMFNMARSEAIFEAASTYKDMEDKLVKEFTNSNGRPPNEAELEVIRGTADRASSDNFYVNTGILSVMNRIQFDNMVKSFNNTRKVFSEGMAAFGDDVFEVSGKVGGKTVKKVYEKGFIGRFGNVTDIAKTFGKKTAAWEATKSLGLGLMKFEGSEGMQELLQDASNKGLSDYYYDLYHGKKGYDSKMDKILASVKNPLTDMEGAKTFLMGALTGRLIAPFSYAGGKIFAGKDGKAFEARKREAISIINNFYSDPTQYTKEWVANVKVQNKAAKTMEEAVANGDKYTFYNTKDSAFAKAVASAIKLNMYDSLKDTLTELGKEMNDEEFQQAFKMEAGSPNRQNVSQFMDKIVNQMDEYYTLYNNLKDKYGDRIVPELYRYNKPEEYERVKIAKIALDNAIEMLTTNVFKARQTTKRAAKLQSEIGANPNIGASSTELLNKLGSEQAINDHVSLLDRELSFLENSEELTPDQKALLKAKRQELKLAKAWQKAFEDVMTGQGESYFEEGSIRNIYSAFENLINFYNQSEKKNVTVSIEDMEESFTKILDYIQLNKDGKAYVDAMNILADPYNMKVVMEATKSSIEEIGKLMQREHIEEVEAIPVEDTEPQEPTTSTAVLEPAASSVTQIQDIEPVVTAAPVSDIEAKKADIERRRQEELAAISKDLDLTDKIQKQIEINDKYDAELAALKETDQQPNESAALEAALKEAYDNYVADASANNKESKPASYEQWKDFSKAAKDIRAKFSGESQAEAKSEPETYAEQFDVTAVNTEAISPDVVDQILSSTSSEKNDNFDSKADDFLNNLSVCNL